MYHGIYSRLLKSNVVEEYLVRHLIVMVCDILHSTHVYLLHHPWVCLFFSFLNCSFDSVILIMYSIYWKTRIHCLFFKLGCNPPVVWRRVLQYVVLPTIKDHINSFARVNIEYALQVIKIQSEVMEIFSNWTLKPSRMSRFTQMFKNNIIDFFFYVHGSHCAAIYLLIIIISITQITQASSTSLSLTVAVLTTV